MSGTLFQEGDFTLASGKKDWFKIECDALTETDWKTLARIIASETQFNAVYGVPTGAETLADFLKPYCSPDIDDPILIVDDVFTTGGSIIKYRRELMKQFPDTIIQDYIGVVVFARNSTINNPWIRPMFQMWNMK